MDRHTNIRDVKVSSTSGKDVKDTSQLKGEAKDSLGGKNSTVQFETNWTAKGPFGAKNTNS